MHYGGDNNWTRLDLEEDANERVAIALALRRIRQALFYRRCR